VTQDQIDPCSDEVAISTLAQGKIKNNKKNKKQSHLSFAFSVVGFFG